MKFPGKELPFAVSPEKAGTGRLSDSTGEFTLFPVYTLDTLVVSYVGYQTVFIPRNVNRDTGLIRVELKEKPTNEVVVNKKYNRSALVEK